VASPIQNNIAFHGNCVNGKYDRTGCVVGFAMLVLTLQHTKVINITALKQKLYPLYELA